jgi:SAM-dependent methyltransferase
MKEKSVFQFGKNWESFSRIVDAERLATARESLQALLGNEELKSQTFLDIGCGSGLFSIAAMQLGAVRAVGIDVDPLSVETSKKNAQKWMPNVPVSFEVASALNEEQMNALGAFDIVYSWGVLHHTGNMRRAMVIAARHVKPGGTFAIAIYNRHFTSPVWKVIKWFYNKLPAFAQRLLIWVFTPVIFLAKFIVTGQNPLNMKRGMDFMHNIIDWLGGYPYEYASINEMTGLLESLGMKVQRAILAGVPTGCNEFVCKASK